MQFQESISTGRNDALSLAEAKAWFENIPSSSLRTTSDNKQHLKIRTPLWNRAIQTADSNYSIVELPVQFDKSPGIVITTSQAANLSKPNDVVRLLILKGKRDGTMHSALMHIVSDNGIGDSTNTYGKRNTHFSGFIFYTNLDGSFNGWKYKDGKITLQSTSKAGSNKISRRVNMGDALSVMAPPSPEPVDCSTYTIIYEERYCVGDVCTPWVEYDRETYTYCTGGGGGGGGGGIQYIEYDEPYPEPPDPQPDPCATTQASTATDFSKNNNYLSAKTAIQNAANDGKEHVISFGKTTAGTIITSELSNGDDHSGEVLPVANQFADLHNHPNNKPFDSGDLYGFIDHAVKNSSYIRYVVTINGTVYALVITDLQAAENFNVRYPRVSNGNFEPDFPEFIENEINKMTQIERATDEMALAFILSKYNAGIALLRQDTFGDFKRLNTKENIDQNGNQTYQSNNCQ